MMQYDAYVDVTTLKTRWWRDRFRQLTGMNTVNLSFVCKFTFAIPPENICVSGKCKYC